MKKRLLVFLTTILLVLSCVSLLVACGGNGEGVLEEVKLDQTTVELKAGTQMTVQVQATTKAKSVTFSSSDENIFTVVTAAKTAVISPVGEGEATLTATTGSGKTESKAICTVKVNPADNLPVILFDKATLNIRCGKVKPLPDPENPGAEIPAEDPNNPYEILGELTAQIEGYDGEVTYTSSLKEVATIEVVNNKVTVHPKAEGPTVITASFKVDGVTYLTRCNVQVRAAKAKIAFWSPSDYAVPINIFIDDPASYPNPYPFWVTVSDYVYHGIPAVTSSDTSVASTEVGTPDAAGNYRLWMTIHKKGTTTLTAVVTDAIDGEQTTATLKVTVNGPASSVSFDKTSLELETEGAAQTLTAATANYLSDVTFEIADEEVATIEVGEKNKKKISVTPVGVGTTTVTAKFTDADGEHTATCTITVKRPSQIAFPSQNMTVENDATSAIPKTITLNYTKKSGDPAIRFETGDPTIATVTAGGTDNTVATITPLKVGKTTLIAKLGDKETKTIDLEVTNGGIRYVVNDKDKGLHAAEVTKAITGAFYIPDFFYDSASKTYLPVTGIDQVPDGEGDYDGFLYAANAKGFISGITSVSLGANLQTLTKRALAKLPAGCTSIDFSRLKQKSFTVDQLFYGGAFTSIVIPDDITGLGTRTFQNCAIVEMTLSKGMTALTNSFLQINVGGKSTLKKLFIPKTLTTMDATSISDLNGVQEGLECTFYYEGTEAEWKATSYYNLFKDNSKITVLYSQTGIPKA